MAWAGARVFLAGIASFRSSNVCFLLYEEPRLLLAFGILSTEGARCAPPYSSLGCSAFALRRATSVGVNAQRLRRRSCGRRYAEPERYT
jgi:hypothetical protein